MTDNLDSNILPDEKGFFGEYGGSFIPPELQIIIDKITAEYNELKNDPTFKNELKRLYKHYVGRPSPIFHARNLSEKIGGAQIYLKREDLNHTGAHKINHCLGEALVAKKMGKTTIIAETGAGQHGVALATAAALVGLKCKIYMGNVDIQKERPNVTKMRILGADVIPVTQGTATLKDAVDVAFMDYLNDPVSQLYAIGSVVGPHPFPMMVRDFQSIVGEESKEQFNEMTGKLPDNIMACVGGGSNAIGMFSAFLKDQNVNLYGVEPAGIGFKDGEHAATLTYGKPGVLHGMKCYVLQDENGEPVNSYTNASGLNYPGIGPQHSYLKDIGRVNYVTANDKEAIDAFFELAREEGIIPAIESSHAIAYAIKLAATLGKDKTILLNLSGRGEKDIDFIINKYGKEYGIE